MATTEIAFRPFVPLPGVDEPTFDMHAAVESSVLPNWAISKYRSVVDLCNKIRTHYSKADVLGATVAAHAVSHNEMRILETLYMLDLDKRYKVHLTPKGLAALCLLDLTLSDLSDLHDNFWEAVCNTFYPEHRMLQVVQLERLNDVYGDEAVFGKEVIIQHHTENGLVSSDIFSDPNHNHYPLHVADMLLLECAELHESHYP